MIPVDQTRFGPVDGNCMAACVASILEIAIGDVVEMAVDATWRRDLDAWLAKLGLYSVSFALKGHDFVPPGYYVLGGGSPRGDFMHAVVAKGSEIVHDPHPSRAGVTSREDATIFVRMNPALRPHEFGDVDFPDDIEVFWEVAARSA